MEVYKIPTWKGVALDQYSLHSTTDGLGCCSIRFLRVFPGSIGFPSYDDYYYHYHAHLRTTISPPMVYLAHDDDDGA